MRFGRRCQFGIVTKENVQPAHQAELGANRREQLRTPFIGKLPATRRDPDQQGVRLILQRLGDTRNDRDAASQPAAVVEHHRQVLAGVCAVYYGDDGILAVAHDPDGSLGPLIFQISFSQHGDAPHIQLLFQPNHLFARRCTLMPATARRNSEASAFRRSPPAVHC